MVDLSTSYMGLRLPSPVVVAACSISGNVDNIKRVEAAGAGGLVVKSLFEEQVMAESLKLVEADAAGADRFAESLTYFPSLEHAGPREHLMWVGRTRKAVAMPLFGSVNAVTPGGWPHYARQMQDAGVDGLELNVYAVQADLDRTGQEIEEELYETVESVLAAVTVPVAVKLSAYYTSVVNVAGQLDRRGVKALVLFNRFVQPDIDPDAETLRNELTLSRADESRLPMRHVALLFGKVEADLAAATGVDDGVGAVKQILAGASAVQIASALYARDIEYVGTMNQQVAAWMGRKGYAALADFRGKLSQEDVQDPFAFERAQYVELLMQQT